MRVPLRADAAGSYYLDLVPFRDGWTPHDPANPAHRAGRKVTFLADTGAEMTLVGPDSLSLLAGIGTAPARTVTGFNGPPQMPLQTGYLVIYPPEGAVARPPLEGPCAITFGDFEEYRCSRVRPEAALDQGAAAIADMERVLASVAHIAPEEDDVDCYGDGGYYVPAFAPVFAPPGSLNPMAFDHAVASRYESTTKEREERARQDAEAARVNRVRMSAFPPVLHPEQLCDRYNCLNAASLRALVRACPLGVSPDLLAKVPEDMDFGQSVSAGLLKAPPIHATRHLISQAIRDASRPGHVWWMDLSNLRPADFDGNTYSRLFADERTQAAVTF